MIRSLFARIALVSRKAKVVVGIVGVASIAGASFAIAPALAGWTHTEYDNGPVKTLNCATGASVNSRAYGQLISGEVAGNDLTSNLAQVAPLNVSNIAPATSSSATGATPATGIGGDAWTSALNVQALNAISITPTVSLPVDSSLSAGTQYARATSGGIATGASGAVNGAGNGTVSFQSTGSATALGSLDLHTALSSVIGSQLASDLTQLSDASLTIGAVGSISDEQDGCQNLWQGIQNNASSVARSYLLSDVSLNLSSSLVGKTTTAVSSAVSGLDTTLNALEPSGSILNTTTVDPLTHESLTGALDGVLNVSSIVPGVGIGVTGAPTAVVGVTFNLGSISSLLTSTISSGGVSINLGTGTVSVDLATLLGKANLNGLPANSQLLSATNISSILGGITTNLTTLIDTTVNNAVKALISSAAVTVTISTDIGVTTSLLSLDALTADIQLSGTLGQFLTSSPSAPTIGVTLTVLPGLLSGVANGVTSNITSLITGSLGAEVLPVLDDLVLSGVNTSALSDLASALTILDGTPLSGIETAFGTVLGVVQTAVSLTVNAQPDQVGGVGTPDGSVTTPGRFFDSALVVGVLDTGNSPVLGLYLGSSSAGPISLR